MRQRYRGRGFLKREFMAKKLIVNLGKAKLQEESGIECSYKHHPENKGFDSLLEKIRFVFICRKCEEAPCVTACPRDALEKVDVKNDDAGVLQRWNMLCTGCGTCAIACPFGTIYTDLIPFTSSVCDVCMGRLKPGEEPLCVGTCKDGSVEYREVGTDEEDLVEMSEGVVVNVPEGSRWEPFLREKEKS